MRVYRWFIVVFFALISTFAQTVYALDLETKDRSSNVESRPFVMLVQPTDDITYSLWFKGIDRHARQSAEAMDMDLVHFFVGDDRSQITTNIKDYVQNVRKPDYLLFSNQIGIGMDVLALSKELNIKAFLYGSPLEEKDFKLTGGPGSLYPNWIGQIVPDDEAAGYNLANILIEDARQLKRKNNDTTPIKMIGISGTASTTASAKRSQGLRRAVAEHTDVELLQVVSARWVSHVAAEKYELLTQRYGDLDVVWAANDDMALAALEKAKALGGHVPKFGGYDWTPPAVEALKTGDLSASMGGHDIEVAFAMTMLRADFDGYDILEKTKTANFTSDLVKLTPENVDAYMGFIKKVNNEEVDYSVALSRLQAIDYKFSGLSFDWFMTKSENLK